MKFTKLPLNGASWADELLYTFDTEFAEPIDVIVDIINSDTREIIGQQRLRGVTTGSINIAPYIRSKMQALQVAPIFVWLGRWVKRRVEREVKHE